MSDKRWGDKRIPVTDLMDGSVPGQPWPVVVTMGNLDFFRGGTDDDDLCCCPLNNDNTVDTDDVGVVDFWAIDPEVADACRKVADLLRAEIEVERVTTKCYEDMGRPDLAERHTVNIDALRAEGV